MLSSPHPHTQRWGVLNTWTVLDFGQGELGYARHNYSPLPGGSLQRRWPAQSFCFPHICNPLLWEQHFWPCHLPVLVCSHLSLKFRPQENGLWVQELWTLPQGPAAIAPQLCHPEIHPSGSAGANHRCSFTMSLVLLLCGCYECVTVRFCEQIPLSALLKEPMQDSQKKAFAGFVHLETFL